MNGTHIKITTAVLALLMPTAVFAHSGHHESHGVIDGFMHTLTGVDHLLMAICFGFLARNVTNNLMPIVAAIAFMAIGFGVGLASGYAAPVEFLIAASLVVVAAGMWTSSESKQMFGRAALVSCIGFIFFHGYAHGVESGSSILGFAAGMLACATLLMALGYKLQQFVMAQRWISVGVASFGALLMLS